MQSKKQVMQELGKVYNKKIEIWCNQNGKNEIGELDKTSILAKSLYAQVIPQTGKLQTISANTILSNVTTKVIIRFNIGIEVKNDMWIMLGGRRLDIKYVLNPFERNETLELFCEEVK
ncbi:MAG: phage head closure protein [Oscillospiraceae bacterium]